jgi:GTP-binding protein
MANRGQFVDEADIEVVAGKGGDGHVGFRHEAHVPKGGPHGGDGGYGGDVVLVVDPHLRTLLDYTYRRVFRAGKGVNGGPSTKTGARGADCVIPVPPGTEVLDADTGEVLVDLVAPGQKLLAVRGGTGGRGNAAFATPTRQAPRYAERGLPGEHRRVRLVLKLLGDVGLVGLPNVGKSTLLAHVSAARPRVADYPFTTLQPNLGVVKVGDTSFVLADLPGLIEGAHHGRGLGHQFLRHVERTRLLVHVLDAAAVERDPVADYGTVNEELELYAAELADLRQIVAINKVDVTGAPQRAETAADVLRKLGREVFLVSAATGEGLQALMRRCAVALKARPLPAPGGAYPMLIEAPRPKEARLSVRQVEDGIWEVRGTAVEREVLKTRVTSEDAVDWLQERLEKLGLFAALASAGAKEGDTVRIAGVELEYEP